MAGNVGLSQALSYARDLKSLYETSRARERELEQAQERLRQAYAQSRQYAVDLRKTYRRLQHAIFQSLLGLANAPRGQGRLHPGPLGARGGARRARLRSRPASPRGRRHHRPGGFAPRPGQDLHPGAGAAQARPAQRPRSGR